MAGCACPENRSPGGGLGARASRYGARQPARPDVPPVETNLQRKHTIQRTGSLDGSVLFT
jgi:hypothetical protein